ncbi:hypothetical protein DSO57_1021658 [Entomophthora muscae]|uniref:Uncharacterized protein n=1 Tax=Entomophthora muscae TaxID=34485 RepID=A0ACC2TR13_9FUNG|nr:hypothetical protein DSO57_1021658 [Entomophthora muscae]
MKLALHVLGISLFSSAAAIFSDGIMVVAYSGGKKEVIKDDPPKEIPMGIPLEQPLAVVATEALTTVAKTLGAQVAVLSAVQNTTESLGSVIDRPKPAN